jgi:hypothetical protein
MPSSRSAPSYRLETKKGRLAGCLAPLTGDPDLAEIIVVDDEPSDRTAAAGQRGAAVLAGRALPPGWAGKACALDHGCATLPAISCSPSTPTLFHGPSSRGRSPLSSATSSSSAQGRASDQLGPSLRRVAESR